MTIEKPLNSPQPVPQMPKQCAYEQIVARFPNLFARLVYLAGLFDPATKRYRGPEPEDDAPAAAIDTVLRLVHSETFAQWRALSLGAQCAELYRYLNLNAISDAGVIREWANLGRLSKLCPPGTYQTERDPFLCDLILAVRSLLHDFQPGGVSSPWNPPVL